MAKEFLSHNGIEFEERNVAENPDYIDEMLEITDGLRGVPVIVVGDKFVRGWDEAKVAELVGIKR